MGLSCWLDREMKKGDNVHLYQCQSTRAPGFITDIKQRKQKYIENNTWSRGDMEFIFECSHRYRTSERSERVRYRM